MNITSNKIDAVISHQKSLAIKSDLSDLVMNRIISKVSNKFENFGSKYWITLCASIAAALIIGILLGEFFYPIQDILPSQNIYSEYTGIEVEKYFFIN